MSTETLFTICNYSVMPLWLLLVFAPGWKYTHLIVHSFMLPMVLVPIYAYLMITSFGSVDGAGFGSLEGIMAGFTVPELVLAGWIHYLAFDLFIGAWEARDARRLKIPHLALVPCLVFTFGLGPVGLLFYFILRWSLRREAVVEEPVK